MHVYTCRCTVTPSMTCVICIAALSLNTHQIWSLLAYPLLIYSLAASNFYTPSLCTYHVPQWLSRWMGVGSFCSRRGVAAHQTRPFVNRTRGRRAMSSSKASRGRGVTCRAVPCRAVPCRSFSSKPRGTRSALRAPLVMIWKSFLPNNFANVPTPLTALANQTLWQQLLLQTEDLILRVGRSLFQSAMEISLKWWGLNYNTVMLYSSKFDHVFVFFHDE